VKAHDLVVRLELNRFDTRGVAAHRRTCCSSKRMLCPILVATKNSALPSVTMAVNNWSSSAIFTPMMPFSRKFSYSRISVFLI